VSLFNQIEGLKYSLSQKSRVELREELFERFGDPELRNLKQYPRCCSPYISISHTRGLSGWVAHEDSPIGLDIESSQRNIDFKVISRVSNKCEILKAPSHLALWVAKEAAFKSLWRSNNMMVLSHIEVSGWHCLKENLYQYKFNNINDLGDFGEGWLETKDCFTLGIARSMT